MPLIGRAWKANVNVWKRHLTLQSVFNCGECMMHVDKNANGHVLDVDRISREIAYVPLNRRIKSKRSSCMQIFFFWKKNEYKTCLPVIWWIWSFGRASQRSDGFEIWTCFPEVHWNWIWTCFPEIRWFEVWMCFLEVRWIWNLDVLPKGPMNWNLDVLPRGLIDLKFGHASQRFDGLKFGHAS